MTELTDLGNEIANIPQSDIKLDEYIKRILAHKPVLARIFKETITECKNLSYEEIENSIEGDINISVIGVMPNTSNTSKIEGRNQEDAIFNEGKVTYDLRTILRIAAPKQSVGVKLLVDVEAQKDDTPGYDISERAIYYCCRMISSQLSTEFTNSTSDRKKYGNIKKVYSIWICTETSQKKANTIERYNINRTVYPAFKKIPKSRYDLMEAVLVNISEKHDTEGTENELIKLLTDLFNENISGEEKVELLKNTYNIPTTEEFEKEVSNMTAYAAGLIEKGEEKGKYKATINAIQRMIGAGLKKETILNMGYEEKEYAEAKKALQTKKVK